jgi:hypothetical protein
MRERASARCRVASLESLCRARGLRSLCRGVAVGGLAALCLGLGVAAPARAGTPYVDGISDQSLPYWDGGFSGSYFAELFRGVWAAPSHIALARYVVQWNAMSGGYARYRAEFESWLEDIGSLDLIPDVALTSYDGIYPSTSAEYLTRLDQLLDQAETSGHPVRYLEPWNEPNNQGAEPAVAAAHFTNTAYAACAAVYGCTVIAGNLEDSPNVASYEDEYRRGLNPVPAIWGVHPYYSVQARSEAPIRRFIEHLPNGGGGDHIWFTEVAVHDCTDFNDHFLENGEIGQAERARWLVKTLMHNRKPEHVFYYELLLKNRKQPSCRTEGADDALYLPSGDPAAPDRPRLAAGFIWGARDSARGHAGPVVGVATPEATMAGGAYPGGVLVYRQGTEDVVWSWRWSGMVWGNITP